MIPIDLIDPNPNQPRQVMGDLSDLIASISEKGVIEPLIVAACKVAGYDVQAPFPRLTYDQAMRSYGIDKPDMRIPPFTCVEDLFVGEGLTTEGLPLVMIRIPGVGQVSRKERDELKAVGHEKGLRVFDDMKRLDRDFPEKMAAVRERELQQPRVGERVLQARLERREAAVHLASLGVQLVSPLYLSTR